MTNIVLKVLQKAYTSATKIGVGHHQKWNWILYWKDLRKQNRETACTTFVSLVMVIALYTPYSYYKFQYRAKRSSNSNHIMHACMHACMHASATEKLVAKNPAYKGKGGAY